MRTRRQIKSLRKVFFFPPIDTNFIDVRPSNEQILRQSTLFCEGLGENRGHRLEPEQRKRSKGKEKNNHNKSLKSFRHRKQIQVRKTKQKQTKNLSGTFT